ncbi:hypothetical protein KSP39_PZI003171 [Platanthera zijinensis]|uniref:Knottins-like domain-containing protein n=1 Tax=Platanthera zijinensis TaxID=2320716 RepID=A0AAP0BX51_9ASPA
MVLNNKTVLWFMCLVLLLLSSREMLPAAEARLCRVSGSRGHCFTDHGCDSVCSREGFVRGKCDGIFRRCICDRQC